ncbi:MAG TPA: hypothetical protein VMN79_19000 [Casimicrobiaceae bacterium]|nr:hypothetical protein [Casimicrobiaceae bacterium]
MTRALRASRLLAGPLLASGLLVALPALAQGDARSTYDKAIQRAQQAADQAQRAGDAAMRQAEEAIARIDADIAAQGFMAHELGSPREIVKDAPYTARAVTETTQILMDGNRIVHRSVTLLARDSAGRTRQEKQTDRGATAYIFDPVENRSYVLHTDGKTAVPLPQTSSAPALPAVPPLSAPTAPTPPRLDAPALAVQPGRVIVRKDEAGGGDDIHVEVIRVGSDETGSADSPVAPIPPLPPMPPLTLHGHALALPYGHSDRGVSESLGSRDFDGIRADGRRTTRTIPAGAIGNEKPIAIVSERWFSPDLDVVLMSRNLDPRSGETVYRLTDIKRGEPSAELFRVPADYQLRGDRAHKR